jgi:hypothetical protein
VHLTFCFCPVEPADHRQRHIRTAGFLRVLLRLEDFRRT